MLIYRKLNEKYRKTVTDDAEIIQSKLKHAVSDDLYFEMSTHQLYKELKRTQREV